MMGIYMFSILQYILVLNYNNEDPNTSYLNG